MRNLKRALSLTLASVMLLGMMVVGSSAAGYPDVSEEHNVEAIEVLQAVGVMVGDDNGNFGPDDQVNRAQMAVVMALLLDLDYDYYEGQNPFWDVPTWARPYVAACYANGIVSGYGDGTYGAADPVTAVQAASMMMRALGYFKYQSDYRDGFELSTVRQASKIQLFKDINANNSDPLTRNQVAQLALNTLKTPIVEPDDNTINIVDGNGNLVATGGQVNYVVTASSQPFARTIGKTELVGEGLNQVTGYVIELGEQLYQGSLKLNDYEVDDFGRPARSWEYANKEIGTYAKKELMVKDYVGGVTGKDLYDLLSGSTIDRYDLLVTIDGVSDETVVGPDSKNKSGYLVFDERDMNKDNKEKVGGTGTGTLTQVFVDDGNTVLGIRPQIYIAVINTYLAKAERDYDEDRDELAVTVYGAKRNSSTNNWFVKNANPTNKADDSVSSVKISAEDIPGAATVEKDDFMLVTVAGGDVKTLAAPEILSGVQISAFKRGDNVTVDGTKYSYTTTAEYKNGDLDVYTGNNGKENLKDITYNVFLDAYNNLIGLEEVESVKNYVFITGVDPNGSNIINKTADARGLFLDGTSAVISFKTDKGSGSALTAKRPLALVNTWCTYTVDSNGVYTLNEVRDATNTPTNVPNDNNELAQYHQTFAANTDINSKRSTLLGGGTSNSLYNTVYGDKETVYLTAELDILNNSSTNYGIIKSIDSIVVGAENADLKVWTSANAKTEYNKIYNSVNVTEPATGAADNHASGVYTLYDDSAAVIGAVIVGEDNGASKNLVYVHSSGLEQEAYGNTNDTRANGGEWTWTRYVIQDGEEVLLTEVGDNSSYLEKMEQYKPYRVKLNADGKVIGAYRLPGVSYASISSPLPVDNGKAAPTYSSSWDDTTADGEATVKTAFTDVEVVTDYRNIGYARKYGKDTLLFASDTIINKLKMNNTSSLFVTSSEDSGVLVNDSTRVVLIEYVRNTKDTRIVEEGNGGAKLKNIVDSINSKYESRTSYAYQVTAIMSKGVATSVIIWDKNNDYLDGNTGNNTGKPSDSVSGYEVSSAIARNELRMEELFMQYNTITVMNEGNTFSDSVYVPSGKTLVFKGNVNTTGSGDSLGFGTNARLLVDGTLTTKDDVPATATVRAGNIVTAATQTFAGSVTADQDLIVARGYTLNIASGSTVNVGRAVKPTSGSNTAWINVRGTLYVNKNQITASNANTAVEAGVGIIVASTNSLHILGGKGVLVKGIIIRGDGTRNGRINAPGVAFQGTFVDKNKKTTEVLATMGALEGTVVLNKDTVIEGVNTFAPSNLAAPKGATVKFTAEGSTTIDFVDAGSKDITSVANKTITIGATVGSSGSGASETVPTVTITTDASTGNVQVSNTNIAPTSEPTAAVSGTVTSTSGDTASAPQTPTTPVSTTTVEESTAAIAMGKVYFVYDQKTWEAAYADLGACAVLGMKTTNGTESTTEYATAWSELSDNGKTQLPWLIAEIKNPDKAAIDLKFTVAKSGVATALFTDANAVAYAADRNSYLRSWTMWSEDAQHADKLNQAKTALKGTYTVTAQWAPEDSTAYQTLDAVTKEFTETDLENWMISQGNDAKTYNAVNGSYTYGKLTDLVKEGGNITLLKDIELGENTLTLVTGTTLNLNGKVLHKNVQSDASNMITIGTKNTPATDVVINGTGSIVAESNSESGEPQMYAVSVFGGSKLRMENVTVQGNGALFIRNDGNANTPSETILNECDLSCTYVDKNGAAYATVSGNGLNKTRADKLTIVGGTVKGEGDAMYLPGKAVVDISGGAVIEGSCGIAMKSSELTITNSTVIGKANDAEDKTVKGNGMNTNGSAICVEDNSTYAGDMKIILRNATLRSSYAYAIYEVAAEDATARFTLDIDTSSTLTPGSGCAKVKVSAGTYSWNPVQLLDNEKWVVNQTEDGTYTVGARTAETTPPTTGNENTGSNS